jgi:hypothetical protein
MQGIEGEQVLLRIIPATEYDAYAVQDRAARWGTDRDRQSSGVR